MAKKPPVDRKAVIIQAALDLFIEQGAAFVRLSDVAKKAKVPAPLIHYYFEDIEDLHYEAAQLMLLELKDYSLRELQKHATDPVRVFQEYLKGPLLWASENPEKASIWLYFLHMASRSKKFEEFNTQIRNTGRDRISLMIFRGLESRKFTLPPGHTTESATYFVQTTITGFIIMYASEAKTYPVKHYLKIQEDALFRFFQIQK